MSKTALEKKSSGQDQILEVKTGQDFVFLFKRWYQAGRQPCQLIFSRNVSYSWETQRRVSHSLTTDTLSQAWLHVGRHRGRFHPSCPLIYYIPSLWIFLWLRLRSDIHNRANTQTFTSVGCLVSGISPPKSY